MSKAGKIFREFVLTVAIYFLLQNIVAISWALYKADYHRNDPYATIHGSDDFLFWFPITFMMILAFTWFAPVIFFIGWQFYKKYSVQKYK